MSASFFRHLPYSEGFEFNSLIQYLDGGVQSRALVQRDAFSLTMFSFDAKEGISEYEMQGETWIILNEGDVEVCIGEKTYTMKTGDSIAVPFGALLSIDAISKAKVTMMILK